MGSEQPDEDAIEFTYEPQVGVIETEQLLIGDVTGFLQEFQAIAVWLRGSQLWVLKAETHKWEEIGEKPKPKPALRAIKPKE